MRQLISDKDSKNGRMEQSYSFYIYGAAKTEYPHETNQIPTSIG